MCNSNEYHKRVKEKSRQEKKKIQEHLAQLTKSVICYRIGINNNPVTSLKQIAMANFPFSMEIDNETSSDIFLFLLIVFAPHKCSDWLARKDYNVIFVSDKP